MLQLELVENQVNDCTNSHYTIVYGEDDESPPSAFNVYNMTDFRQMNITFEVGSVEELSPGTYTIEVWEEDWYTGFTAKTVFNLNLYEELASFAGLNLNTTVQIEPEPALNSTEEVEEPATEEVSNVPTLEFDCNGNLMYSWQRS